MFSFRRKPAKKQPDQAPARLRASPSLPDLSTQGIQWPDSLVDVSELPAIKLQAVRSQPAHPAHGKPSGPISTLYMSHPPSAFDNRRSVHSARRAPSQRKNRGPAAFNLMVAGAQGTGKTSLLRLLLETAEVSPTASEAQRTALRAYLSGPPRRSQDIHTVTVEICESKFDRIAFTVVDTFGLDVQPGHELTLERQVSSIIRYFDAQFAETLSEESKVIRQSKGDQHVHLCIYTIDPASIMSSAARRSHSDYPPKPRLEPAGSLRPSDVSAASADTLSQESNDDATTHADDLTMSPTDITVIQRLSKKTNVLPVIARADSLTDDVLATVKSVVRKDLAAAGLDFGAFEPPPPPTPSQTPTNGHSAHQPNGTDSGHGHEDEERGSAPPEERRSRSVIKLRPSRNPFKFRTGSRSRSRLDLTEPVDEPASVDNMDTESVASVRFSAQTVAATALGALLPFALIAPEHHARRPRTDSVYTYTATDESHGQDQGLDPATLSPTSPADSAGAHQLPFRDGPPADLRGVFTRRYRWGTIDVLAPEHCDFAALRTAVLSTHMKMLKIRTREVLYERYRTEKLLARRATRNISEDDTRRMFAEIGL